MIKQLKQRIRNMRVVSELMAVSENYANAMGEQEAGAEHLALAAFDLSDGTARKAFEQVGGDPDAFRGAIEKQYQNALKAVGVYSYENNTDTPVAKKAFPNSKPSFKNVVQEMMKYTSFWKAEQLQGATVLAAISRQKSGVAIRALLTLEIDPQDLLISAEQHMN